MNWNSPEIWLSLITLVILEIVLGIDNIIFISIITDKLPKEKQRKARNLGLSLAMITRVLLLLSISWLMKLTTPLFNISGLLNINDVEWVKRLAISGKDLIMLLGGCFLLYKSVTEIHLKVRNEEEHNMQTKQNMSFAATIVQILLLDIVFSLDSVITAVGMSDHVIIMIIAVVIAVFIMLAASGAISNFVNKHSSVKMLGLSFLMLIGISLIGEGLDQEIPKGYIYFGMAFSILVEMLNIRSNKPSRRSNKKLLKPIYDEIENSKELLLLEEDWDGMGAKAPNKEIYDASIDFLMMYIHHLASRRVFIETPEINLCPNQSIDLSWRAKNARMLINIRKDEQSVIKAFYYGDNIDNLNPIQGSVELDSVTYLAMWMQDNLRK